MATLLISRHPGVAAWVHRQGYRVDREIEHLEPDAIRQGDVVIGILPFQMAAEVCRRGARFLALILDLPLNARGRELSPEEMEGFGARLMEYQVTALEPGRATLPAKEAASGPAEPEAPSREQAGEKILLTFLGTSRYVPTTYCFADRQFPARFSAPAVCDFLKPARVLAGLTPDAAGHDNWKELRNELHAAGYQARSVAVPDGHSEDEFWAIFSALAENIPRGCRLSVDITHGFRSLPIVAILSTLYLSALDWVQLEHVFYGAYQPGARETPLIDLAPFFQINAWAAAASLLRQTHDARPLAKLLREKNRPAQLADHTAGRQHDKNWKKLADALENLTSGLRLLRGRDLPAAAGQLHQALGQIPRDQPLRMPAMKPFLDILREQYDWCRPGMDMPAAHAQAMQHMAKAGWAPQALLLMREWIISRLIADSGGKIADFETRRRFEEHINTKANALKRHGQEVTSAGATVNSDPDPPSAAVIPSEYAEIWNRISDLRNDLAHCGLRENPANIKTIESRVCKFAGDIEQFSRHPPARP